MLAWSLRWWMLAELVAFGALGRVGLGLSWPGALGLALALMLLVRALMNLVTWALAWRLASPAPALGRLRWLALVLREYGAFMLFFGLIQPFERLWMGADHLRPHARPILLVHGYMCNRGCWWWLRRRLQAAGHVVATITLEPPWGGIDGFADQLQARVQQVCAATGARQVTLVAHSMGGLVSRVCLARHGGDRIAGLISIASPHQGSALAALGIGLNAAQMRRGSSWLRSLTGQRVGVPFVSIRTPHDNYVMPQDGQRHPDARDEPLAGVGHLAALLDARTLALVRRHAEHLESASMDDRALTSA